MPPVSKIDLLPEKVRQELEHRLIGSGFGDCRGLSAWLHEQGFEISKTTVNAWGQDYKTRMEALRKATQIAKALNADAPDDEGAMNDAIIRLGTQKILDLLMTLEIDPAKVNITALFRSIADITRAGTSQKKYMAEVRAKGSAVIDEMAKSAGMGEEQAKFWMNKFLGIAEKGA
jgi:Protein of unknown function (DUF3486)